MPRQETAVVTIKVPFTVRKRGGRKLVLAPDGAPMPPAAPQHPSALRLAIDALDRREGVIVSAVSRCYRTPAWGREDQPDFINAVALLETSPSRPG